MKQLLYVEDDENTFHAVKMLLETEGYKVHGAANGKEALEMIAKENHDLILLDIMLPDMSGWDVFEAIHIKQPSQKIAFLSAMPISEERSKVLSKEGVMDYILKPFENHDFIRRINNIIYNH